MWYTRSDDRGLTWSVPVQIDPVVNFAGQSNMVVSQDGSKLYVVRYQEPRDAATNTYKAGTWYLVSSSDGGKTWTRREMFPLTGELASPVVPLAIDPKGTLYFVWSQDRAGTSALHLSVSTDGGRTWSAPIVPFGERVQAMPWAAARADGELGVPWYTADARGRASKVDAAWTVEYGLLDQADTAHPRAHRARVTLEAVHQGNICAKGPGCTGAEDRRLLDYPWMVYGADGRAHAVFASTKWDRPSAFAVYAGESGPLILG